MNISYELLQYYQYKKVIKKKDAEDILAESGKLNTSVRDYMHVKEYTTEVSELEALSEYYNMPCVEVDMLEIEKELFNKLSFEYMKKNKVIPVTITKTGTLLVAIGKPLDVNAVSALAMIHPGPVDFILAPQTQIDRYIDSISAVMSTSQALHDLNSEKDKQIFDDNINVDAYQGSDDDVINNPSVRLVDSVIKEAIPYRASDIHVEPFEKKVRVRYRIDGDLQERASFPIDSYPAICARLKIMSGMDIAEHRIPQDGPYQYDDRRQGIRLPCILASYDLRREIRYPNPR